MTRSCGQREQLFDIVLYKGRGRADEFDVYLARVRGDHKRKASLMKLLDRDLS